MNNKFKSVLLNGLPYGIVFFALAFLMGYYAFNLDLLMCVQMALWISITAYLVNGLLYNRFNKPLKKLESIPIILPGSELLLLHVPANHRVQDNLVCGKLFLTDQRLIFIPYVTIKGEAEEHTWELTQLRPVNFLSQHFKWGRRVLAKNRRRGCIFF